MPDNRKVTKPLDPNKVWLHSKPDDKYDEYADVQPREHHGRGYDNRSRWVDYVIVALLAAIFIIVLVALIWGG